MEFVKAGLLSLKFKFPKYITKFRDPDPTHAPKSNSTWTKEVMMLLKNHDIPTNNLTISLRGYYIPSKFVKMTDL